MTSTSQRGTAGSGKKGAKPPTKAPAKKKTHKPDFIKRGEHAKASGYVARGKTTEGSEYGGVRIQDHLTKKKGLLKKYVPHDVVIVKVESINGQLERLRSRHSNKPFSYSTFSGYSAIDRIEAVREGLPPDVLASVADDLKVEQGFLIDHLGFAKSTIARKVKANTPLSLRESEGLLGVLQLIGLVETMVSESGAPDDFDAAKWVGKWIVRPHPALGNRKPVELLDTAEGQSLVASILSRSQSSSYS